MHDLECIVILICAHNMILSAIALACVSASQSVLTILLLLSMQDYDDNITVDLSVQE